MKRPCEECKHADAGMCRREPKPYRQSYERKHTDDDFFRAKCSVFQGEVMTTPNTEQRNDAVRGKSDTFDDFCVTFNCTPEERDRLAMHLAQRRMIRTYEVLKCS